MVTKEDVISARARLSESQARFARRFGVEQATIHRWETLGIPANGTARITIERVLADLASQLRGFEEKGHL